MDLEKELNDWMDQHQTEYFELVQDSLDEFEAAHPGLDQTLARMNALSMADRRMLAKALGAVLQPYLSQQKE